MTHVRIYQPTKPATQSGRAKSRQWVMEFEPSAPRERDPLMGWTSSRDTRRQVLLHFRSKEDAIAFARKNGYGYTVIEPHPRRIRPKSYAENFR